MKSPKWGLFKQRKIMIERVLNSNRYEVTKCSKRDLIRKCCVNAEKHTGKLIYS